MVKFLDLKSQYQSIKPEIDEAIQSVIENSAFIGGEHVAQFEGSFSNYVGTDYCIGVGNGTDALEIAIEALNLPKGSEIIVPANSFIASAESVTRTGHKIVFCDPNLDNYTINIEEVVSKITSQTTAIMVVHLYGHPCDMDPLCDIAKQHNLKIIEDCAQAHGAEYKGKKVGCIGDVGCFSFYPGKNLGAYGDGGAIVSNNEALAIKCRMIANHGRIDKYTHEFEGRNSRLDGLQAAILDVKLRHLDEWTTKRIKVADYYLKNLKGIGGIILPKKEWWAKQVYHLFVIRTKNRDELKQYLKENGVSSGVHYPTSLPNLVAYKYMKQREQRPLGDENNHQLLSLPIGEHISANDSEIVVNRIVEFFSEKNSLF